MYFLFFFIITNTYPYDATVMMPKVTFFSLFFTQSEHPNVVVLPL